MDHLLTIIGLCNFHTKIYINPMLYSWSHYAPSFTSQDVNWIFVLLFGLFYIQKNWSLIYWFSPQLHPTPINCYQYPSIRLFFTLHDYHVNQWRVLSPFPLLNQIKYGTQVFCKHFTTFSTTLCSHKYGRPMIEYEVEV